MGDTDGDGLLDGLVSNGPSVPWGDGQKEDEMRLFNLANGLPWLKVSSIFGEDSLGTFVALGDVDNDGRDDLIAGTDYESFNQVKIYRAQDGATLQTMIPYEASFGGGVRVASGDFNGDGHADIFTGAGFGGGPHLRVFSGADNSMLFETMVFGDDTSGIYLTAGDVNGDGRDDVVVGSGASSSIRVYCDSSGVPCRDLPSAYPSPVFGGVVVASGDVNGDGFDEVIVAPRNGGPHPVQILDGRDLGVSMGSLPVDTTKSDSLWISYSLGGF